MSSIRPGAGTGAGLDRHVESSTDKLNRAVAGLAGATFLLAGLLGFTLTDQFVSQDGPELLGLQINHLHNIVHLGLGAVLLLGALKGSAAARAANLVVGGGYVLVGLLGFLVNDTAVDVIALNTADNWFHVVVGALLAAVALIRDRSRRA